MRNEEAICNQVTQTTESGLDTYQRDTQTGHMGPGDSRQQTQTMQPESNLRRGTMHNEGADEAEIIYASPAA